MSNSAVGAPAGAPNADQLLDNLRQARIAAAEAEEAFLEAQGIAMVAKSALEKAKAAEREAWKAIERAAT